MSWKASALAKDICSFPSGESLTPSEKCVLLLLAEYCHPESGMAYPAVATLAAKACMTTRNCSKILSRLAEQKVIEVMPRRDKRGLSLPNLYRLCEGGYPVTHDRGTPVPDDRATLSPSSDKPTYTTDTDTETDIETPSVESGDSTRPTVANPPAKPLQKIQLSSLIRDDLFPYYCERTGRNAAIYTLTKTRMDKGISRLEECVRKSGGDLVQAQRMFWRAIEALTESEWHMGRNERHTKYNDWIDNLCKNPECFEKWIEKGMAA